MGKELIKKGFILNKITSYGLEVSLNPKLSKEIEDEIRKFYPLNFSKNKKIKKVSLKAYLKFYFYDIVAVANDVPLTVTELLPTSLDATVA